MKKIVPFAALALVILSTAAHAGDNPRRLPQAPAGDFDTNLSSYTLVVNPEGRPANPSASEAMHYLLDRDSIANRVIYGFTSVEGREQFVAKRERRAATRTGNGPTPAVEAVCTDARFNKVAYGTGIDWLTMYCGQTNPYLSNSWNDVISYVEASGSWTILYKCYYFDTSGSCSTLAIQGGNTINDLNTYGFNNYTSSIKVCPEGITFTECQNF